MLIKEIVSSSADLILVARAGEVGASKALLRVVKTLRDSTRKAAELNPSAEGVVEKLSMVKAYNRILDLPREASDFIERQPEGEEL